MEKQLTAIVLCIVLVFASMLCGCDPFKSTELRVYSELREKADAYQIDFPGYRLSVLDGQEDSRSGCSDVFKLSRNVELTVPSSCFIKGMETQLFLEKENKKNILKYIIPNELTGETKKGAIDLTRYYKLPYFDFFRNSFARLIGFDQQLFVVSTYNRKLGIPRSIDQPPALFVLDLETEELKYAGYCVDFLTYSNSRKCEDGYYTIEEIKEV